MKPCHSRHTARSKAFRQFAVEAGFFACQSTTGQSDTVLLQVPANYSPATRCGPVHPASPLSVCLRCSVSQCARRWCAPHRCRGGTSPVLRKCWSVRWCADMTSARLRIVLDQPSPAARPGRRVRGSCGARPLRPPASLLHNAALPSVPASRCAKAPLGAGHRFAPFG